LPAPTIKTLTAGNDCWSEVTLSLLPVGIRCREVDTYRRKRLAEVLKLDRRGIILYIGYEHIVIVVANKDVRSSELVISAGREPS